MRKTVLISIEVSSVVAVLLLSLHFHAERIHHRLIPSGDEGSWMAVASRFAAGEGFTTRWLEHPFLQPYQLPRPDDYRFPALTLLLAGAFKLFGTRYPVALWTVTLQFLFYTLAVYLVVRKQFGRSVALATILLASLSLLQLMYSTAVYTEALFGIGVACVIMTSGYFTPDKRSRWITVGVLTGFLYLIRPNGILFITGIPAAFFRYRRRYRLPFSSLLISIGTFSAVTAPWLLRNLLIFGNPFHVAGNAGLLRTTAQEPLTLSFTEFLVRHGILHFPAATIKGIAGFIMTLHLQEHGLELIPLLFFAVGICRRRRFFNVFVATAFTLSFLACAYVSNGSWAGVRYFSSFLPFVYAFGIAELFRFITGLVRNISRFVNIAPRRIPPIQRGTTLFLALLLAVPVYYPHKYYERTLSRPPVIANGYRSYRDDLTSLLSENRFYYAASLAQLNFSTGFNCIGMQDFFDEKEIIRAQRHFNPSLMVLQPAEYRKQRFHTLLAALEANGFIYRIVKETEFAVFLRLSANTRS